MKIRYKYLTQTQLGTLFGATSHEVGRWLVEVGLRDPKTKKPTDNAHRGGYCETAPSGQSGYHWVWEAQKTVQRFLEAGRKLLNELPEELVEPPPLSGPFRVDEASPQDVVSCDGSLVVRAAYRRNAKVVTRLLNLAYQQGVISKLCESVAKEATA